MQPLIDFFGTNAFTPHGYCLSWQPVLLWLHVISDLLITLAYYSIPLTLVHFIRQRKDFPYPLLGLLFAAFIIACGTTHLLSAITIWTPVYWLDGLVKAITAIASVTTAVMMLWVIPRALSLPSVAQLQTEIQKRETIEYALRESEYRWKFAVHGSGDGVWDWDIETNETTYSTRWKEMLGYDENDILPNFQEWLNRTHPDDRPRVAEAAQAYLNGKAELYVVEYRLRCKDGSYKWVLARGMVVSRSEDGKPLRMIGTHTDISVRKHAEEALRQNQEKLKEAQRIAHVGSWQLDLMTNHVVWSEELYRIWGLNPELPPPDYPEHFRLFTPESWKRVSTAVLGTKKTGIPYELELEMVRADEVHGWVLARGEAIRNDSGEIVGLQGVAMDITERKQMEQKLRDSDAFSASILNSLTAHIAVLDAQGVIVSVNNAWRQFAKENDLLESSHNLLGFNYLDACKNLPDQPLGDVESAAQAGITWVLKGKMKSFHLEYPCHSPSQQRWFYMTVLPLQGFRRGVVVSHENITERKLMENQLKASEMKFRSIIEASPVPMALNDGQLNVTYLNPAFVQAFGYSVNDIPTLADWWSKAYPDPEYRHWVEASWQEILEKARQGHTELPSLEVAVRCKNNSVKTVLISTATIHQDFAGEQMIILYDITQRKQIEAKLNAIFNASVEGIITFDKTGLIFSANAAVESIFGYKPEELTGSNISALLPSLPSSGSPYAAKRGGQIQEVEGLHKNGSIVPLDLSVAEYSINDTDYVTSIVRDVSSRKQREQRDKDHLNELAHATRLGLMGEMASGIAHEVNQPLSAVSSYTQVSLNLINSKEPDLAKLSETLYKTQQQALRAGRIIHRMREFVKSQTKYRATADINALIHNAADLCLAELKQSGIELALKLEPNLLPVYVDHIQIEQVIINLLRNSIDALKSLPAGQQRQISIQSQLTLNNSIQVRVKDNGAGLDKEQQQKILTPFYTTKADGMGMGLSITRSIVEAHDGTLHFNSELGKGTTFYFTLPIEEKPDQNSQDSSVTAVNY
jgi:PAS domain S-box-containing protein